MADLRGREISMIFQNPRMALNPIRKVGDQIEDVLKRHAQATSSDAGELERHGTGRNPRSRRAEHELTSTPSPPYSGRGPG